MCRVIRSCRATSMIRNRRGMELQSHGLTRLMSTDAQVTGPVNLGNPQECTMLQLAASILDLTGSSSKLIFQALPQDDPQQRRPDISKAREVLNGWEPQVSLDEGLKATITYFEHLLLKSKL